MAVSLVIRRLQTDRANYLRLHHLLDPKLVVVSPAEAKNPYLNRE
jgi:hypothetical protein